MKRSNFNVVIPTKAEGEYLLANMMSGAVIAVDEEMKSALETDAAFDADTAAALVELGILVPDTVDEYCKFKVKYETRKYMVDSPNFTLITTYACNLACPYCYEGKGDLLKGTMTKDTRERAVTFIKKTVKETGAKKFTIALYGGEPLLNFDDSVFIMDSCFTWADDQGIDYISLMLTNGTLLTPEIAETLRHYKMRSVQLTLDGPKRIHDTKRVYKKGGGTFDDIIRAADILREHNVPVTFRVNVGYDTKQYLNDLIDELQTAGLTTVPVVCAAISEGQACGSYSECIHDKDVTTVLTEARSLLETKGQATPVVRPHESSQSFCGFLRKWQYILDPHADVYKCLTFVGLPEHCMGHISKEGEIRYTWAFYDWMSRDPLTIPECKTCTMLPSCGGGCAAVAYERHNTYHACGCYTPHAKTSDHVKWYLEKVIPQHFKKGNIIWD